MQGNEMFCSTDLQADTSKVFPQDVCVNNAAVHMLLLSCLRRES